MTSEVSPINGANSTILRSIVITTCTCWISLVVRVIKDAVEKRLNIIVSGGTGSGSVNCRPGVSPDEGLRAAGIRIASTAWLDALDRAYDEAREDWKRKLYAMSIPGNFDSLYRAHAANPMQAPGAARSMGEGHLLKQRS